MEASKFERYANIACTKFLGGQSNHMHQKKRLKTHIGIFWGMSPMKPILTRGKSILIPSRLTPDSINRSQEKQIYIKKQQLYVHNIYIPTTHIYVRRTKMEPGDQITYTYANYHLYLQG